MLGRDTVEELRARGEQVTGLDHIALDITGPMPGRHGHPARLTSAEVPLRG